jgi:outer membrane protein TolC
VRAAEHAAALAEAAAREWRAVPELSLASVLTGDGALQLAGAVTLPFLRSAAIDGAIAQAGALARAAEALRRQAGADATAAALAGLAELRAQEQEAAVLQERLFPHIRQLVDVARSEWAAGTGAYTVLTDAEAQALDVQRALLRVRAEHAVGRARLREATGALLLPAPAPPAPSVSQPERR